MNLKQATTFFKEESLKSAVQTIRNASFGREVCGEEDLARAFELGNIDLEFYLGNLAGYLFYFPVKNCNPDVKRDLRNYTGALKNQKILNWLKLTALEVETFSDEEIKPNGKDIYFQSLAVHPNYRGQGIAKQLLEQRIESIQERGYQRVFLNSLGNNQKLYLNLGFKPILRLERMFPDGSPGTFMGKKLN